MHNFVKTYRRQKAFGKLWPLISKEGDVYAFGCVMYAVSASLPIRSYRLDDLDSAGFDSPLALSRIFA